MDNSIKYYLITDVGSTTTKAVLISSGPEGTRLEGIEHSDTTVEAPVGDVCIGVRRAVQALEQKTGVDLLIGNADGLKFNQNVSFLSTSSAGGGLQVLVIGLTLFDSASSGTRAAYGAGGIILDTFAIDDKRKAVSQMLAMRNLHPDMILICGGTDGGAITGVLRLAEILRLANPAPKYASSDKIPALYAGNKDAADLIKRIISSDFELHILPNLRPSVQTENLQPTQDKIQQLFMENVMERAPGYPGLKQAVSRDIIPTPLGVMNSLRMLSRKETRNILAVDIGGATTDVFTHIQGSFQRTVSANLGMSYSALNVLREASINRIMDSLPPGFEESVVRNFVANKTLYPTRIYSDSFSRQIEQALAKAAISLALEQHKDMHFNTRKIGYLDILKAGLRDKYEEIFEYQREEEKFYFRCSDIDVVIGAGGIFASVENPNQAIIMLIDAIHPKGITELWIDPLFITPHLGVLSNYRPELATQLLEGSMVKQLAYHLSPICDPKLRPQTLLLSAQLEGRLIQLYADDFIYIEPTNTKRLLKLSLNQKASLGQEVSELAIEPNCAIVFDSRKPDNAKIEKIQQQMRPFSPIREQLRSSYDNEMNTSPEDHFRLVNLPYKGKTYVSAGNKVHPEDVVAANLYDPPRLYIVQPFGSVPDLPPEEIKRNLLVKPGDCIDFDQRIAEVPKVYKPGKETRQSFLAPVRGKIEYLDDKTGILVVSEIQDYSDKPVRLKIASALAVKPSAIGRYIMKNPGDFVYQGETIARKIERGMSNGFAMVKTPVTGSVVEIDKVEGTVTIQYLGKPYEYKANVNGTVSSVEEDKSLELKYRGIKIDGRIGFGRECCGVVRFLADPDQINANCMGAIALCDFSPTADQIQRLAKYGARACVCDGLEENELSQYLGYDPGVINTGEESVPVALIMLSAFGVKGNLAKVLGAKYSDKPAYVNPHTRIRAGVVRPFICIQEP